jgi:hypothetical protein
MDFRYPEDIVNRVTSRIKPTNAVRVDIDDIHNQRSILFSITRQDMQENISVDTTSGNSLRYQTRLHNRLREKPAV